MSLREARKICPGWKLFRAHFEAPLYNYRAFRNPSSGRDSFDTIQVDFHCPSEASRALEKLVAMVVAVIAAGAAPAWKWEGDPFA